jgi:diguanylate cyclase (GGDEF)-like protein
MTDRTSKRAFWAQQIRVSAIVVAASIGLSMLMTWLSLGDAPLDVRRISLVLSFIIPATVSPSAMAYTCYQNLRNHRLHRQVHRLANSDDLTGLANRRSFVRQGEAHLANSGADMSHMALLLIDIDWFKRVNDNHGHEAGDEVLCHVAQTLLHAAPGDALVARLGGEEFTVLCRAETPAALRAIAERLRQGAESARVIYRGEVIHITISLGVTFARPGDTLSALLSRADQALYEAKNHGRNQFALAA